MDKQIRELAVDILQEFTNCYSEADEDALVKMIKKVIPQNAVVRTSEEYEMQNYFSHRGEELLKQERKETAEKFANDIEDILKQPFEGKTEKQEWQRKGMEEGLRMALEICKEITDNEVQNGN